MADEAVIAMTVISLALLTLSILLNSVGIYLLRSYGNKTSNQRLIMMHLSGTEILLAITEFIYWSLSSAGYGEESKYLQHVVIINAAIYGTYYLVLISLTLDRLLASILTIRHLTIFSKSRVTTILVIAWASGTASGIPFLAIDYDYIYTIYYQIIFLSLDAIFLLSAVVTYSHVMAKIIKSRRQVRARTSTHHAISLSGQSQYYKVTTLIIVSFIFLVAVPDIIYVYRFIITEVGTHIEENVIEITFQINFLLDPVIYIFMQNGLQVGFKEILQKWGLWRRKRQGSSEVAVTSDFTGRSRTTTKESV